MTFIYNGESANEFYHGDESEEEEKVQPEPFDEDAAAMVAYTWL